MRDLHPTVNLIFKVLERRSNGDFRCVTDDEQHLDIDISVSMPTGWLEDNDPIGKWYEADVFFFGPGLISSGSLETTEDAEIPQIQEGRYQAGIEANGERGESVTMPDHIRILAFDPSLSHTGVVSGVFDPIRRTGEYDFVGSYKTSTPRLMWDILDSYLKLDSPDIIAIEDMFHKLNPATLKDLMRTVGWIEAIGEHYFPHAVQVKAQAIVWRRYAWGGELYKLKTKEAKKYSLQFAQAHGFNDIGNDDHIADALGIWWWAALTAKTGGAS